MVFESGEKRGAYPPLLIRSRLPPDAGVVQIEIAPPRADAKAIERPSGDQSAETSISSASVTRSALPLRISIFHMSSLPSGSVCVYTIWNPLAENRGSRPTVRNTGFSPPVPAVQISDLFSSAIVYAMSFPSERTMLESTKWRGTTMRSFETAIPSLASGTITNGWVKGLMVDFAKSTYQSEYEPERFVR